MSDALSTVLFEYPLNEKTRTWLRLETLLQQLHENHSWADMGSALAFFRAVVDLLDVLERGDIRTELLKSWSVSNKSCCNGAMYPASIMTVSMHYASV